jgi:hypothetical protein
LMKYAAATLGLALLLSSNGSTPYWQSSGGPHVAADVAERVMAVTRDTEWKAVAPVAVRFVTHHPQGMVKIGDTFYVSSVEVKVPPKRFLSRSVDSIVIRGLGRDTCSRSTKRAISSPISCSGKGRCITRAGSIMTA